MQQAIAAIRFEPILPTILIIVLAVLAIAATALGVYVRARGALFRAAAFALLGFWLAGPTLIQETRQGLSDIALLVVDRSASMQVGTRTGLADHALVELKAEAARLPGLELRSVTVPESGRDGTLPGPGWSSATTTRRAPHWRISRRTGSPAFWPSPTGRSTTCPRVLRQACRCTR